ncbi:MAG: hypothetical protein ACREJM_08755 [Candidatus Saccharimonadales bacterium]
MIRWVVLIRWVLDERERRIYALVDHMFERLLDYGGPYFEQLAWRPGSRFDWV